MQYHDFVIGFERGSEQSLRTHVFDSPAGQAKERFELPSSLEDRAKLFRELLGSGGLPQLRAAQQVGDELFEALFKGRVRERYNESVGTMFGKADRCLRLVLRLDPSDRRLAGLYSIPWELLRKRDTDEFLALGRHSSIVRFVEVPRPSRSMPLPSPLRVLVVEASPQNLAQLKVEDERKVLIDALTSHPDIEVKVLRHATIPHFRRLLLAEVFHVVHFMGHGGFDSHTGEGALAFEDETGTAVYVSGSKFAIFLGDFAPIRLVFLNACHTAAATSNDLANPFSGVASASVLRGVPAVVAMQFPITDEASIAFSSSFYSRFAEGEPLDSAITEGRIAVYARSRDDIEWATVALFSRTPGGSVFVVQKSGSSAVPNVQEAAATAVRSVGDAVPEAVRAQVGIEPTEQKARSSHDEETSLADSASGETQEGAGSGLADTFEDVRESTLFVVRQIELTYNQTRAESGKWSNASLIAAGCGLVMVGATLVSLLAGKIEVGTISAIGSLVPTVVSGLFFTMSRAANKRLDFIVRELSLAREMRLAQQIASTVETPENRDKAILAVLQRLLRNQERFGDVDITEKRGDSSEKRGSGT